MSNTVRPIQLAAAAEELVPGAVVDLVAALAVLEVHRAGDGVDQRAREVQLAAELALGELGLVVSMQATSSPVTRSFSSRSGAAAPLM